MALVVCAWSPGGWPKLPKNFRDSLNRQNVSAAHLVCRFLPTSPHVCSPELEICQSPTKRHERRSSLTSVVDSLQATDQKKKNMPSHIFQPRDPSQVCSHRPSSPICHDHVRQASTTRIPSAPPRALGFRLRAPCPRAKLLHQSICAPSFVGSP